MADLQTAKSGQSGTQKQLGKLGQGHCPHSRLSSNDRILLANMSQAKIVPPRRLDGKWLREYAYTKPAWTTYKTDSTTQPNEQRITEPGEQQDTKET